MHPQCLVLCVYCEVCMRSMVLQVLMIYLLKLLICSIRNIEQLVYHKNKSLTAIQLLVFT